MTEHLVPSSKGVHRIDYFLPSGKIVKVPVASLIKLFYKLLDKK